MRKKKDNIKKIAKFLLEEKCNYCQELLENYLDLFTIGNVVDEDALSN